jgi:hypothetical protein
MQPGDPPLRSFWESSHFRPAVGDRIAARMLPELGGVADPTFGARLDGASIDQALEDDRRAFEEWRRENRRSLEEIGSILSQIRPVPAAVR